MFLVVSLAPIADTDASSSSAKIDRLDRFVCVMEMNDTDIVTKFAKGSYDATAYELLDRLEEAEPVKGYTDANGDKTDGDWAFDRDTGYGPFNSFYAAFTPEGNLLCILNPYDLTKQVSTGKTVVNGVEIKGCNIMWVIPKLYISATTENEGEGTLTLTNIKDPGAFPGQEVSPAFVIDDSTSLANTDGYNFLALGVYEATNKDSSGATMDVLGSKTGMKPYQTSSKFTITDLREMAQGSKGDGSGDVKVSILWNYHQWQLYRYCGLSVMGSLDSQAQVGYGNLNTKESSKTGLSNSSGPYNGSADYGEAVKLFIENSWGSLNDYVDDVRIQKKEHILYAGQNSHPSLVDDTSTKSEVWTWSSNVKGYTTYKAYAPCSTDVNSWGFPIGTKSSATLAPDGIIISNSDSVNEEYSLVGCLGVGGGYNTGAKYQDKAGITLLRQQQVKIVGGKEYLTGVGSRLAFLFDDYSTLTIEESDNCTISLDSSVVGTKRYSADLSEGITVNGSTLTFKLDDGTTATVSCQPDEGYAFVGWQYKDGGTVGTGDVLSVGTVIVPSINQKSVAVEIMADPGPDSGTFEISKGGTPVPGSIVYIDLGESAAISDGVLTIGDVIITPTANEGWKFGSWSILEGDVITVSITEITGKFLQRFDIVIAAGDGGKIFDATQTSSEIQLQAYEGSVMTANGSSIMLDGVEIASVVVDDGHYFSTWSIEGMVLERVTISSDLRIVASFDTEIVNVAIEVGKGGEAEGETISVTYGTKITVSKDVLTVGSKTIVAECKSGYAFVSWGVDDGDYIVTGPMTLSASFKKIASTEDEEDGPIIGEKRYSFWSNVLIIIALCLIFGTPVYILGHSEDLYGVSIESIKFWRKRSERCLDGFQHRPERRLLGDDVRGESQFGKLPGRWLPDGCYLGRMEVGIALLLPEVLLHLRHEYLRGHRRGESHTV